MKKRLFRCTVSLSLCMMVISGLLVGCTSRLALPDGTKLLEDAVSKKDVALSSSFAFETNFSVPVEAQTMSGTVKLDGSNSNEKAVIHIDMDLLDQKYADTLYTDVVSGLAYVKGLDGAYYSLSIEDMPFSAASITEGNLAESVPALQMFAMLKAWSKEIQTNRIVTMDERELYEIGVVLNGESLYNLMAMSMGGMQPNDEEVALMKNAIIAICSSLDLFLYVEVSGGRFAGLSINVNESMMQAIKSLMPDDGSGEFPDSFTLKGDFLVSYEEENLSFPEETQNAVPVTGEEEMMENWPLFQYFQNLEQLGENFLPI